MVGVGVGRIVVCIVGGTWGGGGGGGGGRGGGRGGAGAAVEVGGRHLKGGMRGLGIEAMGSSVFACVSEIFWVHHWAELACVCVCDIRSHQ